MSWILDVLGFTSAANTAWNAGAYLAFIAIIVAVLWERGRNVLLVFGPLYLTAYSWLFLHNPLLTCLQILITLSGVLQWIGAKRAVAMLLMSFGALFAVSFLLMGGYVTEVWGVVGMAGLLTLVFGIVSLPARSAFLTMALAGVVLVVYATAIGTWVYVWLNAFFVWANIRTWRKVSRTSSGFCQREA